MLPVLSLVLSLFAFGLLWLKLRSRSNRNGLTPPGPPADPIIGHVRLVPASRPELTYARWGKEYNTDFLHLNILGQPVIVLNSTEASIALLEKRSANYSGRPKVPSLEEQGWSDKLSIGIISTGVQMRKHRKMLQNALTPNNCLVYRDAQQEEARKLVRRIMETPNEWIHHMQTLAATLILRVGYGVRVKDTNDPYVEIAIKGSDAISRGGAVGSTPVDVFPFLRYLPHWFKLIPSLHFSRQCIPWVYKLHQQPFLYTQQEMEAGTAQTSFVKRLLEDTPEKDLRTPLSKNTEVVTMADIKGCAGSLFVAGQDTTSATLTVFALGMTLNPHIQKKAKEELDSVLGHERLPTFADREKLPYVEYVVQETFRWGPVVPLVLPHKSAEDDTYKGYFIPKGSLVIANAYAMNRDESVYRNPEAFYPERYIPQDQGGPGEPFPVGHFGFGRRICPGLHLGTASVWIGIATMLATLDISKAKDSVGNEITPDPNWTTGLTGHPEAFECSMKPRSENAVALVAQS